MQPNILFAAGSAAFAWLFLAGRLPAEVTYSKADLVALLRFEAERSKEPQRDWNGFIGKYFSDSPHGDSYSQADASGILNDAFKIPPRTPAGGGSAAPAKAPPLWGIKIRQDSSDVVQSEDMTVAEPHQKRNQLAGAAFNFSRNILDGEDSWSVRGAIIRPFELYNIENGPDGGGYSTDDSPMMFRAAYFIPSVSLNKVETEAADPKDEVDNLIYRMGVGGRWGGVTHSMISEIELRGFATYATDTSHDASIVAGEFDLEPRIAGQGADAKWALGFQSSLDGHTPPTDDPTDTSNFLYHLRTYLHGEFGDVRDTGGNPDLTEGDFFRLGPVARLEMYPCSLARMLGKNPQGIKLHAAYSYLPTLGGNDSDNNILFSTGLDWSIMETAAGDPIVALKLLYEKGGTELAKDEVETLTLGLGITY